MRVFLVVTALVLVLLVLGACPIKIKLGTPGEKPATSRAHGGESPPVEEPAGSPEQSAGAAGKVQVVRMQVGDEFDEDLLEVSHVTTTFKPSTPTIYLAAALKGVEQGQKIGGKLTAVEVTAADGTVYRDEEVASTDVEASSEAGSPDAMQAPHFAFSPPPGGWPRGSYQAEISVDGIVLETADLTVE